MMKFKRWKKMIVMLMVATMFLQSVVVYADDVPDNPKTESVQEAAEEESTTLDDISNQYDSDVEDDADDQDDSDVEDDADDLADSDADDDVDDQADPDEKDSDEDSNKVTDPVKEEIKAFLDAVADANLPTSIEMTEEYDTVQEKVSELLGRYDALSDKAKEDDGVKDAKSKLDELKGQSKQDMPAEVKVFLDAVAKLPSADEVTAENAEEIGNVLGDETVSDGYGLANSALEAKAGEEADWMTKEISAACAKYEALFEAVKNVIGVGSETYGYSNVCEVYMYEGQTVHHVFRPFNPTWYTGWICWRIGYGRKTTPDIAR